MTILQKGSTGTEVKMLQEDLSFLGYEVGSIDGIFGDATAIAVEQFQRDNRLAVDAIAGENTQLLLVERKTDKTAWDNSPFTGLFGEAVTVDHFTLININPLVSNEVLKNETLLDPSFQLQRLDDKVIDPGFVQSFDAHYINKLKGVSKLLKHLDRTLKEDIRDGRKLDLAGIDFLQDDRLLQNIPDEIRQAVKSYSSNLESRLSDFDFKYQASIVVDDLIDGIREFSGVLLLIYDGPLTRDGKRTPQYVSNVWLDKSLFTEKDSALKNKRTLQYLERFSELQKAGNNNVKTAELLGGCFNSDMIVNNVGGNKIVSPLTEYMKFTEIFADIPIKEKGKTKLERNKDREEHVEEVSGFQKILSDATTKLEAINAELSNNNVLSAGSVSEFDRAVTENWRKGTSDLANQLNKGKLDLNIDLQALSGDELLKVWEDGFLNPLLLKICPATLPRRILECLLPSDCREIIKYIGLWRTRDYLENIVYLDVFDDNNELLNALNLWDRIVEEQYNFKAVDFGGRAGLASGVFDGTTFFQTDDRSSQVSVSLLVRTKREQFDRNNGKTTFLLKQEDSFSIRKTQGNNIAVKIHSQDGGSVEYSTEGSEINVFDDRWHQVGFTWNGGAGLLSIYVDGMAIPTKRINGEDFKGPMNVSDKSQVIVASERSDSAHKTFAGQLDEICIFDMLLDERQWQEISTIDSDKNLNTMGLSQYAKAWWRMGDSFDDTLANAAPGGKIVDRISGIDLTKTPEYEQESKVIVARLFKEEDEDQFINILESETDLLRLCDAIYEFVLSGINTSFDFDRIERDLKRRFQIPTFNQVDPHQTVKVAVNTAVIQGLVRILADFSLTMIQKYLLDCQNWKTMLKAMTKAGFSLSDTPFAQLQDSNAPLAQLLTGLDDPNFWNDFANEGLPFLQEATQSLQKVAAAGITSQTPGAEPVESWTTLGIGNVSFQEEATLGVNVEPWSAFGQDSSITVQETGFGTDERSALIEIISRTSQEIPADEFLEVLSSRGRNSTVNKIAGIVNENFSDSTLSSSDIRTIFGSFGDALGVQGLIGQLQAASETINRTAQLPEDFCLPGQTLSDRLGLPMTQAERDANKATVGAILDRADELNEEQNAQCPEPIPLSDFEAQALQGAITDVYSTVTTAYDNDLLLYRLGMTSVSEEKEEIPKVLWKGDTITRKTYDPEEGFNEVQIEIKKTQINPDFEALLEQGIIPLKKDGTPDGTRFGGVVKINWNILDIFNEERPFLSELRPPESLSPKVEGDTVKDPDVEIKDLGASLGPYTDYEELNATISKPSLKLGGEMADSLSADKLKFTLKDGQTPTSYFSERPNQSERGYKGIKSKSKTSMLGSPTLNNPKDLVQDSYSTITHKVPYGKSLRGEKFVSFNKEGADPFFFDDIPLKFNLTSNLQEEIKRRGYDDTEPACSPTDPTSEVASDTTTSYTPQENVFALLARQNSENLALSDDALKSEAYDSLYREVLTSLLFKVGDSPLLKPVPGTTDTESQPLIGMNFLNLNTTPRLIDMQSFADQVSDDFNQLVSCPEGLEKPPLYEALKTSVPRILARVCVADMTLRGILPFSELFFSKRDPVIKTLIMKRLESDIELFSDDQEATKAKIVEQYNKLSRTGATDGPLVSEEDFLETWKTAMEFFVEEEFDFVANRIKEIVHGKCIQAPESSDDGINEEMYRALLSYAADNSDNLNYKTVAIMKTGEVKEKFSLREESDSIETIRTVLSFSFSDEEIILSKVEKSVEDILSDLDLDFDSIDCSQGSLYPRQGETTQAENHYHEYEIDADGKGITTRIINLVDGEEVAPHEHAIYDYAVVPLLGESDETLHIHSLVQSEGVTAENAEVTAQLNKYLEDAIINTADFKILFDFCFSLNDAASLVLVYCLMSADNQIMSRTFSGTKKAVITMFDWLWVEGPAANPCEFKNGAAGLNTSDMFPDLADAFLDPQYLLMLLLAPLITFKGWSRTADPHVFITQTIMDVLKSPINPRMVKKNVPDPFDNGKIKCMSIPTWPGTSPFDDIGRLAPPASAYLTGLIEPGVAGLVTVAPIPFTGAPFIPTPFGLIYYGLVSPLIWLMKDLPRILALIENDPNAQKILASTGMNVGPVTCDDNVATATGSGSTEEEEEDCPPIRTFQDTIIDSASSACD